MAKAQGWIFADESSLLVAMKSGLIPNAIQGQAVSYWRTEQGGIGVAVARTPRAMSAALKDAGVQRSEVPSTSKEVRLWPAVLPTEASKEELVDSVVLFCASGEEKLLELLGELVRLGCDRCSFQVVDGPKGAIALVRAYDPPYYSVALAMDPATGHQVFVPALDGQERLWIERGCSHPALLGVLPDGDSLELICADHSWRSLPAASWTDVFEIVDVQMPTHGSEYSPTETSERLRIPLRFAKTSREESPSLWVIQKDGQRLLEELLGTMPDDVIDRLLFAVVATDDDAAEPCLLLRARQGRGGPPQLAMSEQGFLPLMGIGNLYVPVHAGVEPPLRRDTLRELLASDPDRVYWISQRDDKELALDSVPESEFNPLAEWADYVIHQSADVLQSWVRSSVFEFSSFQSFGREWNEEAKAKSEPAPEPKAPKSKRRTTTREEIETTPTTMVQASAHSEAELPSVIIEQTVLGSEAKQLAELESEFLSLDAPADDAQRGALWRSMAGVHTAMRSERDAALCWTRAIWEAADADAPGIVGEWIDAEKTMVGPLRNNSIGKKQVRLGVATCLQAALSGTKAHGELRKQLAKSLDESEENLDVRTIWLARTALSKATGGDLLMLARARDGLLRRLRDGLSIENDVPTFLRFAGGNGADREAVQQLSDNLESLLKHYKKTKRDRSAVEAPEKKTGALVGLQFAFGFASLGMLDRAKELRDSCVGAMDASDHVDQFLARAYSARIDQALAGEKRATALPPTIAATLSALPKLDRYKIDRLRSASTILEAQERLDPMRAFQQGGDSRGEEFEGLRGLEEPGQVVAAIRGILDLAESSSTSLEDRARLLDGVMDFFPLISEADAVPALRRVLEAAATTPPSNRALLLEEAMSLTGFFGRDGMTRDIASDLSALLDDLPPDEAASLASEFGSCLRSLRRVGLADQAAELLDRLGSMTIGETPDRIEARLHVAAGQAYVGDFDRARVSIIGTQAALGKLNLTSKDRLRITRALAVAWSHAPRAEAMAGLLTLAGQLKLITDSYNTNSHFCLSVVSFMDSMVLALASGDLTMGDFGRGWLDEDEYLIRRRIHRDMGASE